MSRALPERFQALSLAICEIGRNCGPVGIVNTRAYRIVWTSFDIFPLSSDEYFVQNGFS
ncbi:hypothetical protein V1504DRAFT_386435 [Lipomyces starkeyi]